MYHYYIFLSNTRWLHSPKGTMEPANHCHPEFSSGSFDYCIYPIFNSLYSIFWVIYRLILM